MLPLNELIDFCDKNIVKKDTSFYDNLSYNERHFVALSSGDNSYNTISKSIYGKGPSSPAFKKLKKNLYQKLMFFVNGLDFDDSYQKAKSDIYKGFLSIELLTLIGANSLILRASKRLLNKTIRYSLHYQSARLCQLLSSLYAVYSRDLSKGEWFHEQAMHYLLIYNREVHYLWLCNKIRAEYGRDSFSESIEEMKIYINEIKALELDSVLLNFIYLEFQFFIAYIEEDNEAQKNACYEGLEYFQSLPYHHTLGINVFTFHLLDVLYSANELATVELIIKNQLESPHIVKGNHYYRYKEQLLRVMLYQGKVHESEMLLFGMSRKGKKLGEPFIRERIMLYELYMAILKGERISLRRIHYRLNKIPRSHVNIINPLMVGKVIYFMIHGEIEKAEKEVLYLTNYSKVYKSGISERTQSFVNYLIAFFDVRNIKVTIPPPSCIPPRHDCEIIKYDLLKEIIDKVKVM